MNGQVFPLFEYAHILRTPMLTELRDYAFEYGRLMSEGFSDGIVSGCAITTTADTITLNRGVIRYGGQMYLMVEPITLTYQSTDIWAVFKLEFKDESRQGGYIYRAVEATISGNLELRREEMELCRFKLQRGAHLRMRYVDFADRNTEFDTVNSIYAPYSAYEKNSISPEITRAFAREALTWQAQPLDEMFILQALNAKTALNRETILYYIAARLKKPFADCDNLEIFRALQTILQTLQSGDERELTREVRRQRHIIVD